MPMELRDLRALLAVVRLSSFTAAAAELGYTQSAVSQQIAALEGELGQVLFERRPVRPTPACERLAEHAQRVLQRLDVARSELAQLGTEPSEIRVAACPSAAPGLLASALRDLRALQPAVHIVVRTLDPPAAVGQLASGQVDAALVDGVVGPSEPLHLTDPGLVASTAVSESTLIVALPARHPLARRLTIDLDVLVDAPWVSAGGATALAAFDRVRPIYEGSDVPTMLALVAAGLGVALVPGSVGVRLDGIATVPLGLPRLIHRTELLTLREASPRHHLLTEALRSALQRAALV